MKKISYALGLLAAVFFVSVSSVDAAQSVKASKTSVLSGEEVLLTFTGVPYTVSQNVTLACPDGVEAFFINTFTPVPCGTPFNLPTYLAEKGTMQFAYFVNKSTTTKSVVVSYSMVGPASPTPVVKSLTVKVSPVATGNRVVADTLSLARITFGYEASGSSRISFECPVGVAAMVTASGKGTYDLCKQPLTYGYYYGSETPKRPSYIDVKLINGTTVPTYVTPVIRVHNGYNSYVPVIDARLPTIAVRQPVYFTADDVDSKEAGKLMMFFPAKTKGTVKYDCPAGLAVSTAKICEEGISYAALPASLSSTFTNRTDESQVVRATVCAYDTATSTSCVEHKTSLEIGPSPSIIDVILSAFDPSGTWKSRFGDPTDKLIKVSVFKYDAAKTESLIIAPQGATYAIVRAWGAAGGVFGNDNWYPYFSLQGAKTNFTPGGYGGFTAGKVAVKKGDYFGVKGGKGGEDGLHGGDNNDDPGKPGGATSVTFNGQQIMVAGGGAQFLHTVGPTLTMQAPSEGVTKRIENLRVKYSSGGSQFAGVTTVAGVSAAKRSEVINIAKVSHGAPNMTSGGGGKVSGGWYVWPWFSNSYYAILTGGSSYINTAIVSDPTYFVGNPGNNTADKGAWVKYFPSGTRPALPGRTAGNGAVVVEFWGPANATVCEEGASDDATCDTATSTTAAVDLEISKLSIKLNETADLSLITSGVSGCVASSTVGAGSWSGPTATSARATVKPLTIGDKTYGVTCADSAGVSLSDSVTLGVTSDLVCDNGGINPPLCTIDDDGCLNGATDFPACTTGGTCSNGATNWPTCTLGVCTNGAVDYPACKVSGDAFSIGPDKDIRVTFPPRGEGTSDAVFVPVNRLGSFAGDVTLGISGRDAVQPALPDDVDILFSINGGDFVSSHAAGTVAAGVSAGNIAVKLSKKIFDACGATVTPDCRTYSITVRGLDVAGVLPPDFLQLRIQQRNVNPTYQEE